MKKNKTILIFMMLMICSIVAIAQDFPEGAFTHRGEAEYIESEITTTTKMSNLFSVGTFTKEGIHDIDWLLGETMYVKMDETPYKVSCRNVVFVIEFYKRENGKTTFKKSYSSGYFGLIGYTPPTWWKIDLLLESKIIQAVMQVKTDDLGVGEWRVLDYLHCDDVEKYFIMRNPEYNPALYPRISSSNLQNFVIRKDAKPGLVCEEGWIGAIVCQDHNLHQFWLNADCSRKDEEVVTCPQTCYGDKCVSYLEKEEIANPKEEKITEPEELGFGFKIEEEVDAETGEVTEKTVIDPEKVTVPPEPNKCGNGVLDKGETCENCLKDAKLFMPCVETGKINWLLMGGIGLLVVVLILVIGGVLLNAKKKG